MVVYKALVYPSGTYHFCLNDMHLVIDGFENVLNVNKKGKRAWETTELYETCNYAKQFFENNMDDCPMNKIKDINFIARYQNYGCYIASNINSNLFESFETYLGQQNNFLKDSLIKYDGGIQVWPPDTFHYCFDNNHVTIKGNDMVLAKATVRSQSKRGWSNYERTDSRYYIRQHFKEKSNKGCDLEELVPYPVRSYGGCFVSMNTNISRALVTETLRTYIANKCTGCNKGFYYDPVEDMNNGALKGTLYVSTFLVILITIMNLF